MPTLYLSSNTTAQRPLAVMADRSPRASGRPANGTRMTRFAPPQRITRTIIASEVLPALRGGGEVDFLCGFCGAVIVEGVDRGQLLRLGFKCPMCTRFSELPTDGGPMADETDRTSGRMMFPAGVFRATATITVPRAPFILFGERSA
jgi:hypothetical protein